MNNPTISSTPSSSAGRPDTTWPNTTSPTLLYLPSNIPHPVCTIVLKVTPHSPDSCSSCLAPSRLNPFSTRLRLPTTSLNPTPTPRFGNPDRLSYPFKYSFQ